MHKILPIQRTDVGGVIICTLVELGKGSESGRGFGMSIWKLL